MDGYFLVKINERTNFYIPMNYLESFIRKEQLIAMLDIDLQINYLKFRYIKLLIQVMIHYLKIFQRN